MKGNNSASRWIALVSIALVTAALTGRLTPRTVNDTASYLDCSFDSLEQLMLSTRTPGYPAFLKLIERTIGLSWLPEFQVIFHATACCVFLTELRRRGMPSLPAVAAATAILFGCTAMDHISTISTDAPAASLGILTAAFLMRACRTGQWSAWTLCGIFAFLAILFRPAYLFLIPWIAVAGVTMAHHDQQVFATSDVVILRRRAIFLAFLVALPLLAWMGARKLVVNEFGLLPFGHQNLSALLVQLVPTERLRNFEGDGGELAARVADRLESDGFLTPDRPQVGLPTMTIENQWDKINYFVVWPIAEELEKSKRDSPDHLEVRVHRRIGAMNRQIIAAAPISYGRWIVLGIRRSLWGITANIAMHPVFGILIVLGLGWLTCRCFSGDPLPPLRTPDGWTGFAIVGISYAAMKVGFVVLTSPPLGRFADAAAIFLPALLVSAFVPVGMQFRSSRNDDR